MQLCVTGGTDAHESFSSLPCNCDVLLFGRYSLEELKEMQQSTQSIETDFSAKAMLHIATNAREQRGTLDEDLFPENFFKYPGMKGAAKRLQKCVEENVDKA